LGAASAFCNQGRIGIDRTIRPLFSSMAMSHRDMADTPSTVSAASAERIAAGISFVFSLVTHKKIWVSKTINRFHPLHPRRSPIPQRKGR
jgi:hypothetical protein